MNDRVLRAITVDGSFRIIGVRTTDLVREAIRIHGSDSGAALDAKAFCELLTGAIIVRETMAPSQRLQMILSRDKVGQVVVDSHPDDGRGAITRGLVNRFSPEGGPVLGGDAVLRVIRSLPRGRLHQSIVEATGVGITHALMHYMQVSEQVVAMLGIATVFDGDQVVASGGYLVQLLPECTEGPLAVMTERLAHDFASLDRFIVENDADPAKLLEEVLYGFAYEKLADAPLRYGCDCSEERVLGAIATLGRAEVADVVARGEVMSLTCEYCRTTWSLGTDRLKTLLIDN